MTDWKFYQSIGICPKCKKRTLATGKSKCEICLAKQAEITARYRNKHGQSTRQYEITKKLREKRLAEGKCQYCGKPSINGWSCIDHYLKEKRRYQKQDIPRTERPEHGLCYICGSEIDNGKICDKCREKVTRNVTEYRKERLYYHGGW